MHTEVIESYNPITAARLESFNDLDEKVKKHVSASIEMIDALRQIRDHDLWREGGYPTFAAYIAERFESEVAHAYRKLNWLAVCDAVEANSPTGDERELPLPNERQARELAKLPDDEKKDVWEKVVKDGKPTANAIKEEIERRLSPKCPNCGGEEWASDDDGEFCPKCKEPGPTEPRVIERDLSQDQEPVISRTQRNKAANLRAEADVIIRQVIDAWPADDFDDLDAWWKGWRKEIKKGSN